MPAKLPKGWVETTLGEVCARVANIYPEDSPDVEFTYFDIGGIDNQSNRIVETKSFVGRGAPSRARHSVRKDDILFSTVRTYLKKIARIEKDYPNAVASTGFTVIRAADGVSPHFLFSQVLSESFLQPLHALQSGSSYPAVRDKDVFAQTIRLAPTSEQERIVAKLEAMLSQVAKGETAARRALDRLQRYRAAVLRAAVNGELTSQWRKSHEQDQIGANLLDPLLIERRACWEEVERKRLNANGKPPRNDRWKKRYREPAPAKTDVFHRIPDGWVFVSIDQLAWASGYGTSVKCTVDAKGPAVLRIPNIRNGGFDLTDLKFATKPKDIKEDDFIEPGDFLLIRTNGSIDLIGRGGIATSALSARCSFASYLIRFRLVGDDVLWSWISIAWASDTMRSILESRAATTAGQYNLSLSGLADIPIPIPPRKEQLVIVHEVNRRLLAADRLASTLNRQLERARATRQHLLRKAFAGELVRQDPTDESASDLLRRIRAIRKEEAKAPTPARERRVTSSWKSHNVSGNMTQAPTTIDVQRAWQKIGKEPNAKKLFEASGFSLDQVTLFYESLRAAPEIIHAFKTVSTTQRPGAQVSAARLKLTEAKPGRFRLVSLWLEDFKNLKDYEVRFDATHGLDIVLGWNGTGKSNLFEAIVIIFRDLHYWWEKNKWPETPIAGYRLQYEIENQMINVKWNPSQMKRPEVTRAAISTANAPDLKLTAVKRENVPLPRFVFGYYSGPTNRLADHFWPMKRDHYERLRKADSDNPTTLTTLLEQRRFFCAEASHAKYVLLAFSYKEDPKIWKFLEERLRIVGFESALFVIRKPRWAKGTPDDFWKATGIMRRVMEKLKRYAIAPMVLKQKVADGYSLPNEELYYFFLPDLQSLHAFAAEYADARSFFLALESTDFSELIHDVRIQVRVKAANKQESLVTFRELSEGEQQLLMVLGLMRFTKSHQSLILLDEPDTHLNPHWSVHYLKDLAAVVSDDHKPSPEQQTSQLLMATHDPLVIASLVKDQIHLLKRDPETLSCHCEQATVNPKGLGFTGILTSEMFGFRSDLDPDTLADLDNRVRLVAKEGHLSGLEKRQMEAIDNRLAETGFLKAFSDPYYAAFVRAWGRRYSEQMASKEVLSAKEIDELDRIAKEILTEAVAEVEKEV